MRIFSTISDIEQFISEQPIDETFYQENWVEVVARELHDYLIGRGFQYGEDSSDLLSEISDENFWGFFKNAEVE